MLPGEFMDWCLFRQKYGMLHPGMRIDRAVARVGAYFGNAMAGRKALTWRDFSPYDAAIENERELTNSEILEALKGIAHGKN